MKKKNDYLFIFKGKHYTYKKVIKLHKSKCPDHPDYKFILVPEIAHPDCLQCHINWHYYVNEDSAVQNREYYEAEYSLDPVRIRLRQTRRLIHF